MNDRIAPVPLGRELTNRVRKNDEELQMLAEVISKEGFQLMIRVLRELGTPTNVSCSEETCVQMNALKHQYGVGWNECLHYAENLDRILGGWNNAEQPPVEVNPEEMYGAKEIRKRNDPLGR